MPSEELMAKGVGNQPSRRPRHILEDRHVRAFLSVPPKNARLLADTA